MIVFPDTNVLYPIRLADLLAWTDELLTEIERVLVDDKRLDGLEKIGLTKFVSIVTEYVN